MVEVRIKVLYRKNLRMSTGKACAQVAHAVRGLNIDPDSNINIVVLQPISDAKFCTLLKELVNNEVKHYTHFDKGLTEVPEGTLTTVAYIQ